MSSMQRLSFPKLILLVFGIWLTIQLIIFISIDVSSEQGQKFGLSVDSSNVFNHILHKLVIVSENVLSDVGNIFSKIGVLNKMGLGENGRAVHLPAKLISVSKDKFGLNQFDVVISDLISLNRSLPDYRSSKCIKHTHDDLANIAHLKSSVIIVFHNEAWSTLLRTVHSIINRTPASLLHEIILVDDASNKDFLKKDLDNYLLNFNGKVKIFRNTNRSGLIRARLNGAKQASGETLTFLDAHCEVTKGWLEPLLVQISINSHSVVCPIIDIINEKTFAYEQSIKQIWGVFDWSLTFDWGKISKHEQDRRTDDESPIRTPAMAGGLFTIRKDYFYQLGAYDEGMEIWGGENVEMSLRVWQCGGELLIIPCSHVGHVFRLTSPYSWPGGITHILNKNRLRTANVWLDEYLEILLMYSPALRTFDFGNVTQRQTVRKKLSCRSFRWYLANIYPESAFRFDVLRAGEIRNPSQKMCLEYSTSPKSNQITASSCHGKGGTQLFLLTNRGELVTSKGCLQPNAHNQLFYAPCSSDLTQQFKHIFPTKQLMHVNTGLCIRSYYSGGSRLVKLYKCGVGVEFRWYLPPAFKYKI